MQTIAQRLAAVETSLKRWHTRLTIASNKVTKLEKQRRRLTLEAAAERQPVIATVKVRIPKQIETDHLPEPQFEQLAKHITDNKLLPAPDLTIPEFLDRGMKAQKAVNTIIDEATKKRLAKNDLKRRPPSRLVQKALDARDRLEGK